jgi:glycosyltransferase involved in cell wall biosynthesis
VPIADTGIAAMDVSVIIPTHGRPQKVAACVRALAGQTLDPGRYEVLVGLDGPDPDTEQAVTEAWPDAPPGALLVVAGEHAGPNPVRNRLLPLCRGNTLILLNDDVRPDPEFLAVHEAEQRLAAAAGRPAMIVGHSPWVPSADPADETLFDRLVRDTSMVFFYDRMNDADPQRDWGFRHAWSLNLSMPTDAAAVAGGWAPVRHEYGHDDLEMAWRVCRDPGLPVLYRPAARAPHDHRLTPHEYLVREFKLGRSAWLYARRSPDFGRDLLGRDVTSAEERAYSRAFVRREQETAARVLESFVRLADLPATAVEGPHAGTLVSMLYEQHLPLKRWMWRAGVLAAADGRAVDDVIWPARPTPRSGPVPKPQATPHVAPV